MRRIIHIDMDAFYASVEQRDDPTLRGRPIAVGHDGPRGVVMTASYEARRFGVGSAMPSRHALERCPELVFVLPRMDVYREVSREIREVFARYTDLVEPLSLDEAYLDVTEPKQGPASGTLLATRIKREILTTTGLTASAGVSLNKFLAKIASGIDKPDGLTVITPDRAEAFVAALPVERFFGVGPVTTARMHELGIRTGADLKRFSQAELESHFGKHGRHFYRIARAEDERPVEANRPWKSIGVETTFEVDLTGAEALCDELPALAELVAARLARAGLTAGGVIVKVKYRGHRLLTRRQTLPGTVTEANAIREEAERILRDRVPLDDPVRLLGITLFDLLDSTAARVEQASLFD